MSFASARHQVLQARSAKAADQTQRDIELAQETATKASAEARLKLDRTQAQMSLFIEPLAIQASSYISATFYMMADLFPAWTASVANTQDNIGSRRHNRRSCSRNEAVHASAVLHNSS